MIKQKYIEGAYFLIPLKNSKFQLGRIIKKPIMIIYDYQFDKILNYNLDEILGKKKLFIIPIASRAITNNFFKIIAYNPLDSEELKSLPPQFHQKIMNLNKCTLIYLDGREVSASPQECVGLEALGSWDVEHVIERIENYYQGIPNLNYELTKVKIR